MDDLHEASLLWNLRIRYDTSHFYTYVGSILVSINPYTLFPDLYGLEMAKKYAGAVLGKFKYLQEAKMKLNFYLNIFSTFFRSTTAASFCNWTSSTFVACQSKAESGHNHYRGIGKWWVRDWRLIEFLKAVLTKLRWDKLMQNFRCFIHKKSKCRIRLNIKLYRIILSKLCCIVFEDLFNFEEKSNPEHFQWFPQTSLSD